MTYKDAQHLLAFLKFYKDDCDGTWGPKSKEAMKTFQTRFGGLDPTGLLDDDSGKALRHAVAYMYDEVEVDPETSTSIGTFWDEIEYFDPEEFRCKCGGKYCNGFPSEPKEQLVRIADRLRKNLGVPITIVSGLRCQKWNAIQGGVSNSQHMHGEAADIYAKGISQSRVEAELDAIGGVRYHYPIVGSNNVHFDIPKGSR
jgi:hypothetical protein